MAVIVSSSGDRPTDPVPDVLAQSRLVTSPRLTPLLTIDALLGTVLDVGPTPTGFRRVIPIVGGTVSGSFEGVVLPGGADWNVVRPDGSNELWARYELRLADGAVVSVTNTALVGPVGEVPFLTHPVFDVGDDGPVELRWGLYAGVLTPAPAGGSVHIEVFRVEPPA